MADTPRAGTSPANWVPAAILCSPGHRLQSGTRPVLAFTGRRYATPVKYLHRGQELLITTDSTWWRELRRRRTGAGAAALAFTVVVNVPINLATGRWDPEHPPPDWDRTRTRWELSQGIRSWLLLIGFVLVCVAATT